MLRLLIRLGVFLGSSAIGLLVAAAVLDRFSVSASSFVVVVLIFAVLQLAFSAIIPGRAVLGAVGLVSTFAALVLTAIANDGLHIRGVSTWIWATVIVWIASMLATWGLGRVLGPAGPARRR